MKPAQVPFFRLPVSMLSAAFFLLNVGVQARIVQAGGVKTELRVALPAEAVNEACKNQKYVRINRWADSQEVKNFRTDRPCSDDRLVIPRISILGDVQEMSDWVQLRDFAIASGQQKMAYWNELTRIMTGAKACMEGMRDDWNQDPPKGCKGKVKFFKEFLLPTVTPFRQAVALAFQPATSRGLEIEADPERPEGFLNLALDGETMGPTAFARLPLTGDERDLAFSQWRASLRKIRDDFEAYLKETVEVVNKSSHPGAAAANLRRQLAEFQRHPGLAAYSVYTPAWQTYQKRSLEALRNAKRQEVLDNLEDYRILAYLKSANPKPSEIAQALTHMIDNVKTLSQQHAQWITELQHGEPGNNGAVRGLTSDPVINSRALAENPSFCPIAEAWSEHRSDVQTVKDTAAVAGLVGLLIALKTVPAGAPALIQRTLLTIVGLGSSVHDSLGKLDEANTRRMQALSFPAKEKGPDHPEVKEAHPTDSSVEEAEKAASAFELQLGMSSLGNFFLGKSALKPFLR